VVLAPVVHLTYLTRKEVSLSRSHLSSISRGLPPFRSELFSKGFGGIHCRFSI
jgi:hypothetical protein